MDHDAIQGVIKETLIGNHTPVCDTLGKHTAYYCCTHLKYTTGGGLKTIVFSWLSLTFNVHNCV